MIKFISGDITLDAAAPIEGAAPKRSVSGVAVPYGVAATVSDGTKVIFEPGSLSATGKAPKLYMNHDSEQAVGIVSERVDTPQGMMFTAKLSKIPQADIALELMLDQVIDSVSVGVNPTKFKMMQDGTMLVQAADWLELSLVTGRPAFSGAVITQVAATSDESIHHDEEDSDNNEIQEPTQENEPMSEATPVAPVEATIPTSPIVFAEAKRAYKMPSAGEYIAAMHIGGDTFRKVNAAYREAATAGNSALQAASEQDLVSDVPGLVPVPTLGPVFKSYNFVRPIVSALGTRAMPGAAATFTRATIAQHTSAGVQSPQGSQVSSQTMILDANSVAKQTVAGSIFIAQQTMDFTDPAAMTVILDDLAGQYMKQTDTIAANALVAAKQPSGYTWTITSGDITSLMNGIYGAAANISATTNLFPTHMIVDPSTWYYLGSQLDESKRPIFPSVGAAGLNGQNTLGAGNATSWSGMNPLGLDLVVDGNLPGGTMLIVHGPAAELYEAQQGMRSIENPDLLGRTFSYYGYFATFFQTVGASPANSQFVQSIIVAD